MNEILVAITLIKIDEGDGNWLQDGVCDMTNAEGLNFRILASGNLSDDRLEFLHDWVMATDESGEVLFAGSFSQTPTLADDAEEGIFNIGAGLASVLADKLALNDDEAYEIFDFVENAIWQISPNYALEYLQMAHSATIGSDEVEFESTPRFYIHRSIGICEPASCASVEAVPEFMRGMMETADFDPMDNRYELAVTLS